MIKRNGIKETARKLEKKVTKQSRKEYRKDMEKSKKVYKKRKSFTELIKGASLKGKLD